MVNEDIRSFVDHFDDSISKATERLNSSCKEKLYQELHDVNVVIGGPPCQGFSMAGSRIRKTSEFIDDPRNFLFRYYFKIIQKFEPQYFVFENQRVLFLSHYNLYYFLTVPHLLYCIL